MFCSCCAAAGIFSTCFAAIGSFLTEKVKNVASKCVFVINMQQIIDRPGSEPQSSMTVLSLRAFFVSEGNLHVRSEIKFIHHSSSCLGCHWSWSPNISTRNSFLFCLPLLESSISEKYQHLNYLTEEIHNFSD